MSEHLLRLMLIEGMLLIGGLVVTLACLAIYLWFWADRFNR